MFKKINGFTVGGVPQPYIDERFQYFLHYWGIVKHKNKDIFFDEVWFESHRSLITKIENQIEFNFNSKPHLDKSFEKIEKFFLNHSFFQKDNIIGKDISIQRLKKQIEGLIVYNSKHKSNYVSNINKIKLHISSIKRRLFVKNDYSKTLANHLIEIISINQPLTTQAKSDIRFLVSAFFTELYLYGYNLKYIESIPEIIFSYEKEKFPFDKTIDDFGLDRDKYNAYLEEELKNKTLTKSLLSIANLVNRPLKDGYYIFKVDNMSLIQLSEITIGPVSFYNPQETSKINIDGIKDEVWKDRCLESEKFYPSDSEGKLNFKKPSYCNAIISAKIRSHESIDSSIELFQAHNKVCDAVVMLNFLAKRHNMGAGGNGKVTFHKHIKLHKNKKIANMSFGIFAENSINIEPRGQSSDEKQANLDAFNKEINFINKIDSQTNFGSRLLQVISAHNKLKNNEEIFNFKDLWIALEGLLGKQGIKNFSYEIFYIRYKRHFLQFCYIFLNFQLRVPFMYQGGGWILDQKELKSVGLSFDVNHKHFNRSFKSRYKLIESSVPIEIIKDVTGRIDNFIKDEAAFLDTVKQWIDDVLDEVYVERNMEVHNNIRNDLSALKLKEDFLRISHALYYEIVDFMDKRNPNDLDLVMKKIINYKNKL